jgi:hypothetical protein
LIFMKVILFHLKTVCLQKLPWKRDFGFEGNFDFISLIETSLSGSEVL